MIELDLEVKALLPHPIDHRWLSQSCSLPYSLEVEHVFQAMSDFVDFLGFFNQQLHTKRYPRLETFLMPAGFSSLVGEFMNITIPRYCRSLAKNRYHNGHPDLIPRGLFPNDAVQYSQEGIEVKGSRHSSGWQGHNP